MENRATSPVSVEPVPAVTSRLRSPRTPQILVDRQAGWPERPAVLGELLTPVQAAQYLRLDEVGHTPRSAIRVLNYWRSKSQLKATKYARRVWFLKTELDHFLQVKTEP